MTVGIVVLVGLAVLAGIYFVLLRAESRDRPEEGGGADRGEGGGG